MKNSIISILLVTLMCINIISCNNQRNAGSAENNYINNEEEKLVSVDEESKSALIQNLGKYFDIDLNKENFNYFISENIGENELLDKSEKEDVDDLDREYIVAISKDNHEESGVSSVDMDYKKDTNIVDYMKVLKFEKIDETSILTMEDAIPISEKFIYDKNFLPLDVKLKPEAITNDKGMAVMEFSYVLDGESDNIKIGINSLNKEVRMFDID